MSKRDDGGARSALGALLALAALAAAMNGRQDESVTHGHRCSACGREWEHSLAAGADEAEFDAAHRCPGCGADGQTEVVKGRSPAIGLGSLTVTVVGEDEPPPELVALVEAAGGTVRRAGDDPPMRH